MRLDDVWLQTTLNTPNISGVWQIKKWSLVSLKAHQPRQGQSPLNKQNYIKKKQTCQWTLTLTWLVGFQTNKRPLFYLPNT
jgi:hypothetical protein